MNNLKIAFSGKKGVGKTTSANYLQRLYGFKPIAFADYLKRIAQEIFHFEEKHLHDVMKDIKYAQYDWTPREFLVKLGAFIRYFDSQYFLNKLDLRGNTSLALHDCRYKNEADFLRLNGFKIVRINRYSDKNPYKESNDASETDLDNYKFDYTIEAFQNDTLLGLFKALDNLVDNLRNS